MATYTYKNKKTGQTFTTPSPNAFAGQSDWSVISPEQPAESIPKQPAVSTGSFNTTGDWITQSGQKISPLDPNYSTYVLQGGYQAPTAEQLKYLQELNKPKPKTIDIAKPTHTYIDAKTGKVEHTVGPKKDTPVGQPLTPGGDIGIMGIAGGQKPQKITQTYANAQGQTMEVAKGADIAGLARLGWTPQDTSQLTQAQQNILNQATGQQTGQTNERVQVKNVRGETITVYKNDIPALIAEGTLPAETTGEDDAGIDDTTKVDDAGIDDTTKVDDAPADDTGVVGNDALNQLLNKLIQLDPFFAEQMQDSETKSLFDSLTPELKGIYLKILGSLGDRIKAGEVVNPDITITPEQVKVFLDEMRSRKDDPAFQEFAKFAGEELDPYFDEQIDLIQDDVNLSLSRLQDDFDKGIRRAEEPFKLQLGAQAEGEAQAGTAFSSGRGARQERTIDVQQQRIDDYTQDILRGRQDIGRQAERKIGTKGMQGIDFAPLSTYQVGEQGFAKTGTRSLYKPEQGLMGSMPKQREVDISTRSSELEKIYRQQRILDTSDLS